MKCIPWTAKKKWMIGVCSFSFCPATFLYQLLWSYPCKMKWIYVFACFVHVLVASAKSSTYCIMTYNIRYDNPQDSANNWHFRKDELASKVLAMHPAIIGIQEALSSQTSYLKSKWTGYGCYGIGREDGLEKGEMIPVFYDTTLFTCIESNTYWLSENPLKPSKGWDAACERVVSKLTLRDKSSGEHVYVFNTHWDHIGEVARKNSASLISTLLDPLILEKAFIILMGDLNALPNDGEVISIACKMQDTCPEKKRMDSTFNGFKRKGIEGRHIDYIFISRNSTTRMRYKILHLLTRNGRWLSDHHAVLVNLSLKG